MALWASPDLPLLLGFGCPRRESPNLSLQSLSRESERQEPIFSGPSLPATAPATDPAPSASSPQKMQSKKESQCGHPRKRKVAFDSPHLETPPPSLPRDAVDPTSPILDVVDPLILTGE